MLQKCVKYRISQEEIFKYTDDSLLDYPKNPVFRGISSVIPENQSSLLSGYPKKYYADCFSTFLRGILELIHAVVCQNKAQDGIIAGYIRLTTSPQAGTTLFSARVIRDFGGE
ncbi:MAG: hypothetical protein V8S95_03305 [Odoribacter sp.]